MKNEAIGCEPKKTVSFGGKNHFETGFESLKICIAFLGDTDVVLCVNLCVIWAECGGLDCQANTSAAIGNALS